MIEGSILAVDPGLVHPGAAFYRDGALVSAQRVKVPAVWSKLGVLERCFLIGGAVARWALVIGPPDHLIVEWPRWYSATKSGGVDPNDLAGLCGIAGAVAGCLRIELRSISSPEPRAVWGNVPKSTKGDPWDSPRGRRLHGRLSPAERLVVAPYHDALDAAGLALHAAGRWKPRRVRPGAIPANIAGKESDR